MYLPVREAKLFPTLDANLGYRKIEVEESDRHKTTFTMHFGAYWYKRMPVGLKNETSIFQGAIDMILSGVKWQYNLVYLEDIIIFSRSFKEHLHHVESVLKLLQNAGVTLRLRKSRIFRT